MKADKIRQLDTAEIEKQLQEGQEKAFRIRFQLRMGQTDGIKNLRELRKDRARQLTILRERSLGAAKPAAQKANTARKKTEAKG